MDLKLTSQSACIDSVTFSINRTSYPTGHICSINYSYFLRFAEKEVENDVSFQVSVALYGDDLLRNKHIGETVYDSHVITSIEPMPIERSFAVACDILDEAVGEDKIFLKIIATRSDGEIITARSATVKDWF
jgi:hypothetical protein